ncbi:AAA family ATPase [bacterium]|nr:AAA family ATPase [bacterium]
MSKNLIRFLKKEPFIDFAQGEISIKLKDKNGDIFFLSDLSSGEQSLLLIMFAIFGNDLKNGFIIIDEPELHIHPQLQKELAIFLNQISKERGTQIFLSTYSALFINENNITNVYRFVRKENKTNVYTPQIKFFLEDAKLVHILKYENISKIFFVNKIIMVEGDSDLYFFYHYLKWLQEQPGREDIVGKRELVNINGKGSYKARHKFLNRF